MHNKITKSEVHRTELRYNDVKCSIDNNETLCVNKN